MKHRLIALFMLLCVLFGGQACKVKGTKTLLPNVSGKAGEVLVVMDRTAWDGESGTVLRDILGKDIPYLIPNESLFTLITVTPGGFSNMFKVHRNIVLYNVNASVENSSVHYRADVWSAPQCVIQVNARSWQDADSLIIANQERMISTIEQAERDRIITNCKRYEDTSLGKAVREMVGGAPHFPTGYKLRKKGDDFIWISDLKQQPQSHILVYRYKASGNNNFTEESLISKRNEILKDNVPGMFPNTWMTTSSYVTPTIEFIKFRGRQFAQIRGYWDVENDYMGGPFVSHAFYGKGGEDIIVLDAFLYAPKFDKRQYIRQLESIIYSFEWAPDENEDKVEAK